MQKWHINTIIAGMGGVLANLYGGWDTMLQVLIAVIALDYITGILAGAYNCNLSSAIGYKGIIKKVGIFVVVLVACLIAKLIGNDLVRSLTIVFYISNESISILENVGRCGVNYPKQLKVILAQLNKGSEEVKHSDKCQCVSEITDSCKCDK